MGSSFDIALLVTGNILWKFHFVITEDSVFAMHHRIFSRTDASLTNAEAPVLSVRKCTEINSLVDLKLFFSNKCRQNYFLYCFDHKRIQKACPMGIRADPSL
jgi:hypothetical protein